jgi:sarcosine oxidase subunit beta
MQRYSGFSLLARSLRKHRGWSPAWRDAAPKPRYDVVIIGAGGHGLATAWYLASRHGIRNVAVLERHHLGSGNSGRNTQICRSNYFNLEASAFYEHSLKLYESLGRELNFNIMFGQQGLLTLFHDRDEAEMNRRWLNAMALNGIETELLDRESVARMVPMLRLNGRYPVQGGFIQRRAGIARHDAVVWAFARAASAAGVDIVQQCEVNGFRQNDSFKAVQVAENPAMQWRVIIIISYG